ncbi:MAG: thioesterase superfamily protein [Verrucomicrobiales bacterium]|nr:thioesterase superfamily protein [Verrucomicrobiales bacterium]
MNNVFTHTHRVSYAECTLGNHIYYARYLDILEQSRGEFFRHIGEPLLKCQELEILFPVSEVQIKYKGAARYDDLLEISVKPLQITRVRLQFQYEIQRANSLLVEATVSHVCTDLNEKPKRMPVQLADALQRFAPIKENPGAE